MYKICMNHLSTQNAAFQFFPLKTHCYMAGILPIRRKTQNNQSIYRQSQKALKQQDRSKVILIYVAHKLITKKNRAQFFSPRNKILKLDLQMSRIKSRDLVTTREEALNHSSCRGST